MRMYMTPVKLHHIVCPKIQNLWKDAIKCLLDMCNTKGPLNVKLCVLEYISR